MTNDAALFIVIEGLDGSGKSSAARGLKERLEMYFPKKIKQSYEPNNDCCGGEYIRDVLEKRITQFDPFVLSLAYAANRLDHNARVINPWLESGASKLFICDRYYLSSLVYNSAPDFDYEKVMLLNKNARKPDLIFFLNVSAEVCRERMSKRNEPVELFETKLDTYRKKYFSAIQFLREERAETIIEIDGNQPLEQVVDALFTAIFTHFPTWQKYLYNA